MEQQNKQACIFLYLKRSNVCVCGCEGVCVFFCQHKVEHNHSLVSDTSDIYSSIKAVLYLCHFGWNKQYVSVSCSFLKPGIFDFDCFVEHRDCCNVWKKHLSVQRKKSYTAENDSYIIM